MQGGSDELLAMDYGYSSWLGGGVTVCVSAFGRRRPRLYSSHARRRSCVGHLLASRAHNSPAMSVRDRMKMFGGGSTKKVDAPASPAAEPPEGDILWHGWLSKPGSGFFAEKWTKRYMVVHLAPAGAQLSTYEAMDMKVLKGPRLWLADAKVSCAEDKIQLSCWEGAKLVNARLKGDSPKQAAEFVSQVTMASTGRAVAPGPTPPTAVTSTSTQKPTATTEPPSAPPPAPPPAAPTPAVAIAGGQPAPTVPLATPLVAGLTAVASRLAAISGASAPPAASASAAPSEAVLATQLESLVGCLERCADGVALGRLDQLTARLEHTCGLPTPSASPAAGAPPGMDALVAQLAGLVVRMEAAVA